MSEKFVVHKFGGTSVGDAKCFANVSNIVSGIESSKVAVVVSAIGGKPKVTDLLISLLDLAKQRKSEECEKVLKIIHEKHKAVVKTLLPTEVGTPIAESIDEDLKRLSELLRAISIMRSYNESVVEFISGHGEVWSAKILTAVLNERMKNDQRSERFHFVDAREVLTVDPDDDHGHVIQYEATRESLHEFMQQQGGATHLVITGFICSTTEGVMTTLKRDGSDFTASIFGRVLSASSITIWTDVSGVLSADPRRVPESKILQEISYQEAMELAYFGAKVIHPKTMTPAIMENIPIYIRNTFEPSHPGTKIFSRESTKLTRSFSGNFTARTIVSGFSTVDNLALFNIEGSGMVGVHGTSSRLFGALDRVKVNVVLIAQASSEHSICFAIPMNRVSPAL
jgi:aspartokinase/homoserine dehydrogenase 1